MPRLPILHGEAPRISATSEEDARAGTGMLVFLEPIGGPVMQARIGKETARRTFLVQAPSIGVRLPLTVTAGERFTSPPGVTLVGGRYLLESEDGKVIAALNYTMRRRDPHPVQRIVSNIAVAPGWRRQGLATLLVDAFVQAHPDACADATMTPQGAAFMGYAPDGQDQGEMAEAAEMALLERARG